MNFKRIIQNKYLIGLAALFIIALIFLNFFYLEKNYNDDSDIATCNDPSPNIIPDEWREDHMSPGDPYYSSLFSKEAKEKILNMPRVPMPLFSSGNAKLQEEKISKNKLFVDKRGPSMPLDAVDWSVMDYGNYYATQLHAFAGVASIFEVERCASKKIEKRIGELIKNWGMCVAHNKAINPRAWYEGTVIKRQSNLLGALNYMRSCSNLGNLDYEELIYLINQGVNFLLDTPDVYSVGNHGIRQDMLLAATAISLPQHPRANEMLRTAERRLNKAADELFTEQGVWLEHAPGYVHYILGVMLDIKNLAEFSKEFNPDSFMANYNASLDYLLSTLTPTEYIPWIGRSGATKINELILEDISDSRLPEVSDRISSFAESIQSYPEYGHAVLRGAHPEGFYLLLTAAQNLPAGKRHADELSFLLYNHGRVWFTEGGHHSYELSGMTKYLRSSLAHNNYVLGDSFVGADEKPALESSLVSAKEIDNGFRIVANSERFPSAASVNRTVEVNKSFSKVKIVDELSSEKGGPWSGRFHIPKDLYVRIAENVVYVYDSELKKTMKITFSSKEEISFSMCQGQEAPICGWGTVEGEFGPVTTIVWNVPDNDTINISVSWSN